MSLIEDAKRLAGADIKSEGTVWCHFCRGMIEEPESYDPPLPYSAQHCSDCPWLAMPRIVASLEAAEAQEARLAYLVSRLRALVNEYAP